MKKIEEGQNYYCQTQKSSFQGHCKVIGIFEKADDFQNQVLIKGHDQYGNKKYLVVSFSDLKEAGKVVS